MTALSTFPRIGSATVVRGTFRVAPAGALLTSPFSGVRAVAFRWTFCNVERASPAVFGSTRVFGLDRSEPQEIEHVVGTHDDRTDFVLEDAAGQTCVVPAEVPFDRVLRDEPPSSQPIPRFPPAFASVEEASRTMPGEPRCREWFLLADAVVHVVMRVRAGQQLGASSYRGTTTPQLEAVSVSALEEIEEQPVGLPYGPRLARRLHRWFLRLLR